MSKQDKTRRTEIARLLNPRKRKWKGAELGKILMYQLLVDVQQMDEDVKKPLITHEDLVRMSTTFTTAEDYEAYNVYADLQKTVLDTYNRKNEVFNQFDNGYYRLMYLFHEVEKSDEALRALENTPLIMTEEQYKKAVTGEVETIRKEKVYFYCLLLSLIHHFRRAVEEGEDVPAPIKKELESLKEIPASSKALSSFYIETLKKVYYTLPDGRRSDQMTDKAWEEATEREYIKLHGIEPKKGETPAHAIERYKKNIFTKCQELFFRGGKAIKQFVRETTGKTLYGANSSLELTMRIIVKNAMGSIYEPILPFTSKTARYMWEALGLNIPIEWHYCEDLPAGLTAYDLLVIPDIKWDRSILDALEEGYPALINLITTYIKDNVPSARKLKPTELFKNFTTWGELADLGIIGYKYLQPDDQGNYNVNIINTLLREEPNTENKDRLSRYLRRGVAILKNPPAVVVDPRGDYIEEKSPLSFFEDIYSLEKKGREEIEDYAESYIYPALQYVYTFNALMRIFEEVYEIKDLAEITRIDPSKFEEKLARFNNQLYAFYRNVHGDSKEKARKRSILKAIFTPLTTEGLHPSDKVIKAVTRDMKKLVVKPYETRLLLAQIDALLNRLMNGGEGEK
jgi:hypothetical protein